MPNAPKKGTGSSTVPELRINGIVEESIVDGPGLRFVVFTQGCPHRCKGCHNPETHDPEGGYLKRTREIIAAFGQNPLLSGITFSGGEPFMQPDPLAEIAETVKRRGKSVAVFSGFTLAQLAARAQSDEAVFRLLTLADMLVDGPYIEEQHDAELAFRGSANQRIWGKDDIARALEGAGNGAAAGGADATPDFCPGVRAAGFST